MSEETQETNDGTLSGLKKTIIATLTTLITGGGAYFTTTLFGSHDEPKHEVVTQLDSTGHPVAPVTAAPAPVIINVQQNQENTQQQKQVAPTTIIKERIIEKPAKEEKKKEEKPKEEEAPW